MDVVIVMAQETPAHGLALVLEEDDRLKVVGTFTNLEGAVDATAILRPSLLLVESALLGAEAEDLLRSTAQSNTGVAVLSQSDNGGSMHSAAAAHARAYISLSLAPDVLRDAVALAAAGQVVAATPDVVSLTDLSGIADETASVLSARENEVAELVAKGATNMEIAVHLHLTENTVKVHLRNIYRKLALRNRTELASWANSESPAERALASTTTSAD